MLRGQSVIRGFVEACLSGFVNESVVAMEGSQATLHVSLWVCFQSYCARKQGTSRNSNLQYPLLPCDHRHKSCVVQGSMHEDQ